MRRARRAEQRLEGGSVAQRGTVPGGGGGFGGGHGAPQDLDGVVYVCASPPTVSGGSTPQGPGCNIPLLCNSLHLLRQEGGWAGHVWVVTDVAAQVRGLCPMADFEAVEPPHEGLDSLMGVKNLKRQLFKILPGAPSSLIYIDGDILPVGCLGAFLKALPGVALGFFGDTWCTDWYCKPFATANFNRFNGGMVFMRNTPAVAECLEDWGAEIASGGYAKDQDALDAVLQAGGCAVAEQLPSRLMQAVDSSLFWPTLDLMRSKRPIFQHFSHGLRQHPRWSQVYRTLELQMSGRMPAGWLPPSRMLQASLPGDEKGDLPGGGSGGPGAAPTALQAAEWFGGRLGFALPGEI